MTNSMNMIAPLLDEEMEELERFLLSGAVSDEAMSLDCRRAIKSTQRCALKFTY